MADTNKKPSAGKFKHNEEGSVVTEADAKSLDLNTKASDPEIANGSDDAGMAGYDESSSSILDAEETANNVGDQVGNSLDKMSSTVATPGAAVTKGLSSLGGLMGIKSKTVAITLSVLGSATVGAFLLGSVNSPTTSYTATSVNCLESIDDLSYNEPYSLADREEIDGYARSLYRVLGSREVTRPWAEDGKVVNPSNYAGSTTRSWGGSGDKGLYYPVVIKDITADGSELETGTFWRGFSAESVIGFASCSQEEGNIIANGYEMNFKVGPKVKDTSYGGNVDLSTYHHYNWDKYCEAMADVYENSSEETLGGRIAKDAAENLRNPDGPYSYTDYWTGEKHQYPGVGLIGFTGRNAYELQEFCDTLPAVWDMNGDRHNDAMYTMSGQLLYMLYLDDWAKFLNSSQSPRKTSLSASEGECFKLEVPVIGACDAYMAKGHPTLSSSADLTLDQICYSMYLREKQIEHWDNWCGTDLEAYSCEKEAAELYKVRAKWEKDLEESGCLAKKSCTIVEWGVYNTINYDHNIFLYYPGDKDVAEEWHIGGTYKAGTGIGEWSSSPVGYDAIGNPLYEETYRCTTLGKADGPGVVSDALSVKGNETALGKNSVGRINITNIHNGTPVFISFDSGGYIDCSFLYDNSGTYESNPAKAEFGQEVFRRIVGYQEGYLHEHGPDSHVRLEDAARSSNDDHDHCDTYGDMDGYDGTPDSYRWYCRRSNTEEEQGGAGDNINSGYMNGQDYNNVPVERVINVNGDKVQGTMSGHSSGVNERDDAAGGPRDHYKMSVWLWDIRTEVTARDRFGRLLRRVTEGDEKGQNATETEMNSDSGKVGESWRKRGAKADNTAEIDKEKEARKNAKEYIYKYIQNELTSYDGIKKEDIYSLWYGEIKQGQWITVESRAWTEQDFKDWWKIFYGTGDLDSDSQDSDPIRQGFRKKGVELWNTRYFNDFGACACDCEGRYCGPCHNANPDDDCGCANESHCMQGFNCCASQCHSKTCKSDRHCGDYTQPSWKIGSPNCYYGRPDDARGCNCPSTTVDENGDYWCPDGGKNNCPCGVWLMTARAEAVHCCRKEAWHEVVGKRIALAMDIDSVKELHQSLAWDVWANVTTDDCVSAGGLACETLAAQFYYTLCMQSGEVKRLGHCYNNNEQARVHFCHCAHYWEQYLGTLGKQLDDKERPLLQYAGQQWMGLSGTPKPADDATKIQDIRQHALYRTFTNHPAMGSDPKYDIYFYWKDGDSGAGQLAFMDTDYTDAYAKGNSKLEENKFPANYTKYTSVNDVSQKPKAYSAHNTYIDNPSILIERRKWITNDDYCELMMAMWDKRESYPFESGEQWYHSNYAIRTNLYPQNSIARCGRRLDLTNIASTALNLSWPQGHDDLATVNSLLAEPGDNSAGGKADMAKHLCTEAYCKVKDLVFNNGEIFYSSCDRGAMTSVRASGADPLFYHTFPPAQMAYMMSSDLWYDVLNEKLVYPDAINPTSFEGKDKVNSNCVELLPKKYADLHKIGDAGYDAKSLIESGKLQPGDVLVKPGDGDKASKHIMIFVGSAYKGEEYDGDPDFIRLRWPGLYLDGAPGQADQFYLYAVVHSSNASWNDMGDPNNGGVDYARGLMTQFNYDAYNGYYVFRCVNQDYDSMGPKWNVLSHWVELANTPNGEYSDAVYQELWANIMKKRYGFIGESDTY